MNEIKINDYIRTKSGFIGKVIGRHGGYGLHYELDIKEELQDNMMNGIVHEDNVLKHNSNIKELIKESDILKYQIYIWSPAKIGEVKKYKDARSFEEYLGVKGFNLNQIIILEILTKERFEGKSYKVGE